MKFFIKLLFLVPTIILMVGCDDSSDQSKSNQNVEQNSPRESRWCGSSNKVEFGLTGQLHAKFLIPEAYLFDPFGIYYRLGKSKDPIDFISILLNKKDGAPSCDIKHKKNTYPAEFTSLNIKPSYPDAFSRNLETYIKEHTNDLGVENNQFHVYRNTQKITGLTHDILLPISGSYKNKMFLKCYYGRAMIDKNNPDYSERRTGCGVYSYTLTNISIEYMLAPEELKEYEKIENTLSQIVQKFNITD